MHTQLDRLGLKAGFTSLMSWSFFRPWQAGGSISIVLKGQCSRPVETSEDKGKKTGWQEGKNRAGVTRTHIGF